MSWAGDTLESWAPDAESEEDKLRRLAQVEAETAASKTPSSPAGSAFGNAFAQPPEPQYGPLPPTYQENVQAMSQQNPLAGQIAASEAAASDYYGSTVPQLRDQQALLDQRDARQGGLALVNPYQGGFRGPENPANLQPGPNADPFGPLAGIAAPVGNFLLDSFLGAHVGGAAPVGISGSPFAPSYSGATFEQASQTEIPYAQQIKGYGGDAGAALGGGVNAMSLGVPDYLLNDRLGLPRMEGLGRFGAETVVPTNVGEALLLGAGGAFSAGPIEAFTGISDDLVRGALSLRGGLNNLARAATPTSTGYPGLGSPGMGPGDAEAILRAGGMSTEDIAQFFVNNDVAPPGTIERGVADAAAAARGAYPEGGTPVARAAARSAYDNALAPNVAPDDIMAQVERARAEAALQQATPDYAPTPLFPERYPSIPEGTMGSEFPEVTTQWDRNYRVADPARGWTQRPVDPESPAARMGAPLAYDPALMPPPPADAAMREMGLGPDAALQDELRIAQEIADEDNALAQGLWGQTQPPQGVLASEMQDAFARNRALSGGGSTPIPPSVETGAARTPGSPPPASLGGGGSSVPPAIPPGGSGGFPPGIPAAAPGPGSPPPSGPSITFGAPATTPGLPPGAPPPPITPPPTGSPPPPPGGTPTSAPPTTGPYPKVASTPVSRGLFNNIMDTLYTAFGGDVGTMLRQDVTSMLNIFKLRQSTEIIGRALRMGSSKNEALKVLGEYDALKAAADAKVGKTIELSRPDIPGVRDSQGYLSRDVTGPGLLGKIPVVNAPVNAAARANAAILDGRRVLEYVEFVDSLPNRAFTNKSLPHVQAAAQHYADMKAVFTGRGSLGSDAVEKVMEKAGPLFTSLRFALSIPERAPYLIPVQRLAKGEWELAGPAWREAVQEHAGFALTLGSILYAADASGLEVTKNGQIKVGGTYIDLTGGMGPYWNAIRRVADGDYMAAAEFVRNRFGPLPSAMIQAFQAIPGDNPEALLGKGLEITGLGDRGNVDDFFKFMRPDFFNQGATGSGEDWDRALAMGLFLFIQDAAKAYRFTDGSVADKLKAMGLAAGAGFIGAGARTYPPNALTSLRNDFRDDPRLPEAIRGVEYKDLGPDGRAAVDALVEADKPQEYAEAKKTRDENSDDVWIKHREATAKIGQEEVQRKTELYDALRSGALNGEQVRQGREVVESAANSKREAARNVPEYKKAVSELEDNRVSKALDIYYGIQNSIKGPDGKTDWVAVRAKQAEFIQEVMQKDKKTANLMLYEVNTTSVSNNQLDKLYEMAQPLLQKYYGEIKNDYARAEAQRNNPRDDAFLALLGYGKTQTPAAAQILQEMRATLPGNAPAQRTATPPAVSTQPAQAALAGNVGPDGRTVQQITGTAYKSDAERNWYFQSRGLPVPNVVTPAASVSSVNRTGDLPPPTGARLPPVAPGEFNSPTASPQQRENFINAMVGPANAYSSTGIPPAVWAAMGASESNWGRAPSVFGIKGVGSAGGANLQTHEILGGRRVDMPDQFAAYNNLDDAFRHFIDLTSKGRYAAAHRLLEQGDWQGFLQGIVQAGYATDKSWANSIINLAGHIEKNYPQINRR